MQYTINPYNVIDYTNLTQDNIDQFISTTNKELLLNTGDIYNNTIYLCKVSDVIDYMTKNQLSIINTFKIYYPYLVE